MNYTIINNKLLVKPLENKTTLGNGMVIQETRGKKDILSGEVVLSPEGLDLEDKIIYYPEFASIPIVLSGNHLVVVDLDDVILIEENNTHENTRHKNN